MVFKRSKTCGGFSLLELLVAMTLLVSVVTAVSVLLRVNYDTWLDHRSDNLRHEAAAGVLRHMVRQVRQCQEVSAISAATDTSGTISVLMPSGDTVVWDHSGSNVLYGTTTANQMLGNNITWLTIVGYQQDGITPTTTPADIHRVQISVGYSLPSRTVSSRSITASVWIRSF